MFGAQKQSDKQKRYEVSRAYEIINTLKKKNLKSNDILECIEIMYSDKDNTETQQEVLIKAKNIVMREAEMEFKYEASSFIYLDANKHN
jgi:hypothetical protein